MHENLTIHKFDGLGYMPLVDFESWRMAILNFDPALHMPEVANDMERHHLTDEAFVLLAGNCVLYVAGKDETPQKVQAVALQPYTIYNVKKDVWHTLTGTPEMKLLIVENADTSLKNSQHIAILPEDLPKA